MHHSLNAKAIWILLGCVLVGSALLRLSLSPYIQNGDAVITQGWMQSAATLGIAESYNRQVNGGILPQYPPVSLYMFYATGKLYQLLISSDYIVQQPAHLVFVKIPAILADCCISLLLFLLFYKWKRPKAGLLAAIIFALQPAVLYESVAWGQTDSIFTCGVLLSITLFVWRLPSVAIATAILACLIKPQAVAFLPLLFFLIPLRGKTIILSIINIAGVLFITYLPFVIHGNLSNALRVYHVLDLMGETRLSWNAYNFWWMFLGQGALNIPGGSLMIANFSYRTFGMLLFAIVLAFTLFSLRRRLRGNLTLEANGMAVLLAAAMSASGFFLFNAEMHERYFFPYLALALPLCFVRPRLAIIYAWVSMGILFNLLGVFRFGVIDNYLYEHITNFSILIATFHIVFFALTLPFVFCYETRIPPMLAKQKPIAKNGQARKTTKKK